MAKGEISSLAIQALREIGKDNVTEEEEEKVINSLNWKLDFDFPYK